MVAIYDSEDEAALHDGAITQLASEMHRPADVVRLTYEGVYLRLKSQARVKDFLPVLVARHARDALRHSSR